MIRGWIQRFTLFVALILGTAIRPLPLPAHSDLQYCQIAGHRVLATYDSGSSGLIYPWVKVVFQDLEGKYWIGTDMGLNLYDETRDLWKSFQAKDGQLLETDVAVIAQSNDRKLWFGSRRKTSFYGFGVTCFDGHEWRHVDARNSTLKYSKSDRTLPVYTIFAGRNGKVWFGVDDGLVTYDGRTWTQRIKLSKALKQRTAGMIDAGIQDSDGDVWLGVVFLGIIRFDERRMKWRIYNPMMGNSLLFGDDFDEFRKTQATSVRSIFEDRTGRIWFGAANGYAYVYNKRNDLWKSLNLLEHLPSVPEASVSLTPGSPSLTIWSIYEDKAGKMMFATDRGLLVHIEDTDQWELYTPKNSCLPSDRIYSIAEDKVGRIWLGTKGLVVLE